MTPEAQRIAIAEACGWTMKPYQSRHGAQKPMWHHPNGTPMGFTPDYLHDLDAIRDAEGHLPDSDWPFYLDELEQITRVNGKFTQERRRIRNATAAQCAEALVKSFDKWVEETESQPCP